MFTSFTTDQNTSNAIISVTFGASRLATDPPPPAVPLVSSGSLQLHFVSQTGKGNIAPSVSQFSTSFAIGELRTQVQVDEVTTGQPYGFGLYLLANRVSLASDVGRCYMVTCHTNGTGSRIVRLDKSSNTGTDHSTAVTLAQTATGLWNANPVPYALGVLWRVSGSTVTIRVQQAASSPASNPFAYLSTILSVVDTSAAYVSTGSAGVGAGMWGDSRTYPHLHVFFDNSEWRQRFA